MFCFLYCLSIQYMISRNKAMILQALCTLTALNSVIVHLPFPSTEKENKMVSVTPVSATQVQVMKVFFYSPIPLWCNLLPCAIWLVWQHANALFFTNEPVQTLFLDEAIGHTQKIGLGHSCWNVLCAMGDLTLYLCPLGTSVHVMGSSITGSQICVFQ